VEAVREEIEIAAPVEQVWHAVHVDIAHVPRWSKNLARAEVVGGVALKVGSRLRYELKLPGGRGYELQMVVRTYQENRRCAGTFDGGQVSGTWSWHYRVRGELTTVVYEQEVKLGLMVRMAGRLIEGRMHDDVRNNLESLKRFLEEPVRSR
jgi:uncharacterized protein YndB with AHSA1/START domain